MIEAFENLHGGQALLPGAVHNLSNWRLVLRIDSNVYTFNPDALVGLPEFSTSIRLSTGSSFSRDYEGHFLVRIDGTNPIWSVLRRKLERGEQPSFGDLEILDPADSGAHRIITGTLETVTEQGGIARLEFQAGYPNGAVPLCRDAALLAGFELLRPGTFLPQVFGSGAFLPPPLFLTRPARLDVDVSIDAPEIVLSQSVDWPEAGRIQIQDEVVSYRSISSDGRRLGSPQQPVERATPRFHRRGASIRLLPMEPLAWCLADHPASLVEARVEGETGDTLLGDHEVAAINLHGRIATLLRRTALPIIVAHGRTSSLIESDRDQRHWLVQPESNAYDPHSAFVQVAPQQGAVIASHRPVLRASFHRNTSEFEDRFDRLEGAVLSFEFSDSPGWGDATRLRVRIEKGTTILQQDLDRDGVLVDVPLAIHDDPSPEPRVISRVSGHRFSLDLIAESGGWSGIDHAIDGHCQNNAVYTGSGPASVSARFVRMSPEIADQLAVIRYQARVTNNGTTALPVVLELDIPGTLLETASQTVPPGSTEIVTLQLEPPEGIEPSDLLADTTVYRLRLPDGGDVAVSELWLDGEFTEELPVPISIRSADLEASVRIRLPYNRVEINVTPLILHENRWQFFESTETPLIVHFELLEPPAIPLWDVAIRDVHWRFTVFPHTSVRPTEKVWARIHGRRAGADGHANPALVIYDLLRDAVFGDLEESRIDVGGFQVAALECDLRELGFAAVIRAGLSLREAIARASAEAGILVAPAAAAWHATLLPTDPAAALAPLLAPSSIVDAPATDLLALAAVTHAPGVSLRHLDRGVVYTTTPPGRRTVELLWLSKGYDVLARSWLARHSSAGAIHEFSIHPRFLPLPPGIPVRRWIGHADNAHLQGELASLRFRDGELLASIHGATRLAVHEIADGIHLVRNQRDDTLYFLHDAEPFAALTAAGDLLLRGNLHVAPLPLPATENPLIYMNAESRLYFVHCESPGAVAGFAIDTDGHVYTPVALTEFAVIGEPAPPEPASRIEGASVYGGAPAGHAALAIDLLGARLGGAVKPRHLF